MKENYPTCYKAVRVYEGGNDDDPQDPGGRTSRGIIQREWDRFRKTHPGRPADVWKAPEEDIATIYKNDYWDVQRCDEQSSGVDETEFDYGVNSGVGRSTKVLRRCLHLPDNATSDLVLARLRELDKDKTKILIKAINNERLAFLRGLRTWARFGGGWGRRVASVTALSLRLADGVPSELPMSPGKVGKGQHPEPTKVKKAVVVGGSTGGVAQATQFDPTTAIIVGVVIVVAIVGVLYLINRWHNKRQEAPPIGWTPPPELKPTTGG